MSGKQLKLSEIDELPDELLAETLERRGLVKIALGHDPMVIGAVLTSSVVHYIKRFEGVTTRSYMLGLMIQNIITGVALEKDDGSK